MVYRRPGGMPRRSAARNGVVFPRADARTVLHAWVAVVCMAELCAGGLGQGLLTLPAAVIALLDVWHELRTPPRNGSH